MWLKAESKALRNAVWILWWSFLRGRMNNFLNLLWVDSDGTVIIMSDIKDEARVAKSSPCQTLSTLVDGREYTTASICELHSEVLWACLEYNIGHCVRWNYLLPKEKATVNSKAVIFCGWCAYLSAWDGWVQTLVWQLDLASLAVYAGFAFGKAHSTTLLPSAIGIFCSF